ncbi:hypothetical protein HMPREF9372_2510 [Sporosarcina newyorkensis 2681]|uniref:Uncharacterized protein n=1 Tax=Sporosarcina newyorkensis 2681 TaxID=1027292 RepID=F9DUM9_9BACL|nr:hypothetical protein [Sporosarcina newyorkensis]EGQ24211.1 hypothetical protein HMPREF9372_2510 [Sporosarcina newyorkensis 2681]
MESTKQAEQVMRVIDTKIVYSEKQVEGKNEGGNECENCKVCFYQRERENEV